MYVPKHYENENDAEIKDFIKANSFGILINQTAGKLWGTHIPFHFSADETKLYGHISKGNVQWKSFSSDQEVLAIFTGPHAYISPSWYNHENVPTWNYIAVHVYGTIKIIEGDLLFQSLKHMVDKYEKASAKPVSLEGMSPDYVKKHIQALVGFEITITEIKAAYKLSQNRDQINYHNIIDQLEKREDADSLKVAEAMKQKLPTHK